MQMNRLPRTLFVVVAIVLALVAGRPVLAAPVHQEVTPGIYVSDTLPAADSPGREITLFLMGDNSAGLMTDFMNDEPVITEVGEWTDNGDGTLTVTLTGTEEEEYAEPTEVAFAVDGDTLTTLPDDPNYGSEGLTLTLSASEEELMAEEGAASMAGVGGVYVAKPRTLTGLTGVASMSLAEDGTAQGGVIYFGDALETIVDAEAVPLMFMGEWTDNGDGSVTVSFVSEIQINQGAVEVVDASEVNTYTVGVDGELVGDDVTLYPAESIGTEAKGQEAGTLVFVSEVLPAADTAGRVLSLALSENGGAALATDYMNDEAPIVELGTWEETEDGQLLVTLIGTAEEEYAAPVEFVFAADGDTLTTVAWDTDLYGEDGLTLTLLPADSGASSETETGAAATPATINFQSDVLPSADTDGLVITFLFAEDGGITIESDYMNDKDPVVEVGEWIENEDGTVAVTVTGTADEAYATPVEFAVEPQEDRKSVV